MGFGWLTQPNSAAGFVLPANLIIGYNSASAIPSGWTAFTSADNRLINGTTSDGSIGTTGGSWSASTYNSGYAGSHSTSNQDIGIQYYRQGGGSSTVEIRDTATFGNHRHTVYNTYYPKRNAVRLMKASSEQSSIPANGMLWNSSGTTPTGMTAFTTHNDNTSASLYAYTSTTTLSASGSSSTNTWSQTHDHHKGGPGSRVNATIATYVNDHNMSHNHSYTGSYTPNLNRTILKAFYAASLITGTDAGIIGLYDQSGLPDGWVLCDGTNGTKNLNGYFIYNNGTAGGVTDGGNTLSVSSNTNSKGHAHTYGGGGGTTGTTIAHKATINHTHSASGTPSWTPPYYKLKFIQWQG